MGSGVTYQGDGVPRDVRLESVRHQRVQHLVRLIRLLPAFQQQPVAGADGQCCHLATDGGTADRSGQYTHSSPVPKHKVSRFFQIFFFFTLSLCFIGLDLPE